MKGSQLQNPNFIVLTIALALLITLFPSPVLSQHLDSSAGRDTPEKSASAKNVSAKTHDSGAWPGHLPDGQPDVQGVWITAQYGMSCLKDPSRGVGCFTDHDGPNGDNGQPPRKFASRIIDTPDGEIPYQPWAKARQHYLLTNYFAPSKPEFLDPQQLCFPLGPVRQFTWHDVQIIQYDGYVIFAHEGSHVYQIIPLDGRPHVGTKLKLWMGDSRGHWEGNTLVIDVTNNNSKGRLSRAGDFASDKVHNVVRINFIDAHHARYEAQFDDPSVYTGPWTFGFDLKRGIMEQTSGDNGSGGDANYEQWEEACYEGMNNEVDRALTSAEPIGTDPSQK
jgi:hypothetical protein